MINYLFKFFFVFYFSFFSIEAFAEKKRVPSSALQHRQTTGEHEADRRSKLLCPDLSQSSDSPRGMCSTNTYPNLPDLPPNTVPLLNPGAGTPDVEAGQNPTCATKFCPKHYLCMALLLTTVVGGHVGYYLVDFLKESGNTTPGKNETSLPQDLPKNNPQLSLPMVEENLPSDNFSENFSITTSSTTPFRKVLEVTETAIPSSPHFKIPLEPGADMPIQTVEWCQEAVLNLEKLIIDYRDREGALYTIPVQLAFDAKLSIGHRQNGSQGVVEMRDRYASDGEAISFCEHGLFHAIMKGRFFDELYDEVTKVFSGPISTWLNHGRPVLYDEGHFVFDSTFFREFQEIDEKGRYAHFGVRNVAILEDLGYRTLFSEDILSKFWKEASPELQERQRKRDYSDPTPPWHP